MLDNILDMMDETYCPDCGYQHIVWNPGEMYFDNGDGVIFVPGDCPKCSAQLKARFQLEEPDVELDEPGPDKMAVEPDNAPAVPNACRVRIRQLFKRYNASVNTSRHHANGGQGADLDWDDWDFVVRGEKYTISEWGYSDSLTPDKCTPEFIAFIQPGADKPSDLFLEFLKKLHDILAKYNAALNSFGLVYSLGDKKHETEWKLRR